MYFKQFKLFNNPGVIVKEMIKDLKPIIETIKTQEMEHLYTVHTKLIEDKTYYFVKKILALPEFKGLADVVVGYGMHTDFEKACSIAGIDDIACRKQLLLDLEKTNQPAAPVHKLQLDKPVQADKPQKNIKKRPVLIDDTVNHWLAKRGAELLN